MLPCLVCRLEAFIEKNPEQIDDPEEDNDFLRIKLKTRGQRKRYQELRNYRDWFGESMLPDEADERNDNSVGEE